MTQPRRTSSIHLRKKPLPSEVLSSIGLHLDKAKKRETPFGMMFTICEMLSSLPWPGIKTEFYQTSSVPQALTTFPFATPPISDDKDARGTVYERMAEHVRILALHGVPQEGLRNLLVDFDPWNRKFVEHIEKLVSAIRTALLMERKRLRQLNLLLSDPPTLYPLPPKSSTALVAYAARFQRKIRTDEQTVQRAVKLLDSAKQNFASKKSPHLAKLKRSIFQLIKENTAWSTNRTAHELSALLSHWNADLAGKGSSHRIASYRK